MDGAILGTISSSPTGVLTYPPHLLVSSLLVYLCEYHYICAMHKSLQEFIHLSTNDLSYPATWLVEDAVKNDKRENTPYRPLGIPSDESCVCCHSSKAKVCKNVKMQRGESSISH